MTWHETAVDAMLVSAPWSDGLPFVVPTADRVSACLALQEVDADESIGAVPPAFAPVTVRDVAVATVMAGCKPIHAVVVEAALRAALRPDLNLFSLQTTTEPASVLLVLNGPLRRTLSINCGSNLFGNSNSPNAAIGRAVRLVLTRHGNALPGVTDMATFGHPGKLTYCIGENEEESPWKPFHVDRGLASHDSVVTVVGADGPINVNCPAADAETILSMVAHTMATPTLNNMLLGGEVLVILSPEHARILASAGLSKEAVREALFARARLATRKLPAPIRRLIGRARQDGVVGGYVHAADSAEAVLVAVAGGIGGHSTVVPTFGATKAESALIQLRAPAVGAGSDRRTGEPKERRATGARNG